MEVKRLGAAFLSGFLLLAHLQTLANAAQVRPELPTEVSAAKEALVELGGSRVTPSDGAQPVQQVQGLHLDHRGYYFSNLQQWRAQGNSVLAGRNIESRGFRGALRRLLHRAGTSARRLTQDDKQLTVSNIKTHSGKDWSKEDKWDKSAPANAGSDAGKGGSDSSGARQGDWASAWDKKAGDESRAEHGEASKKDVQGEAEVKKGEGGEGAKVSDGGSSSSWDDKKQEAERQAVDEQQNSEWSSQSKAQFGPLDDTEALRKQLFKRPMNITERERQWGTVMSGDTSRLRRVMNKLLRGEKIGSGIVGGSNSRGSIKGCLYTEFKNWVDETFPVEHSFSNGAQAATTSAYMSMCLQRHVPQDVDIVFVEYSVNDGYIPDINNIAVRSYERLLRRLLAYPNRPAIVPLQLFGALNPYYYATVEDHFGVLAQYYRLPWLSTRNMFFHQLHRGDAGYTKDDLFGDRVHLNEKGRSMTGDLMASLLRTVGEGLLHQPYTQEDQELVDEKLPPPMFDGNEAHEQNYCMMEEAFKDTVTKAEGFEWGFEGHPTRPKWGYIATTPGSTLVMTVNTTSSIVNHEGQPMPFQLVVSHLKSYEHMGKAEISCISGCKCEAEVVNAAITEHHSQLHSHNMKDVSAADKCEIQVKVLNESDSGEYKFKVAGLMQFV